MFRSSAIHQSIRRSLLSFRTQSCCPRVSTRLDYYRHSQGQAGLGRTGSSSYSSTSRRQAPRLTGGAVLWAIIGVNTVVFMAWQPVVSPSSRNRNLQLATRLQSNFTVSLDHVKAGRYWTLLTSAFSHFSAPHFISNMISLYAFGSVLVQHPGITAGKMVALSLGSAISGSIGFLIQESSQEPRKRTIALGASGMVMGLGGAAALLAPRQTMLLFGVLPVRLWILMAGYFVYDAYYLNRQSRVAHSGHLGGLSFGAAFYWILLRRYGGFGFGRR